MIPSDCVTKLFNHSAKWGRLPSLGLDVSKVPEDGFRRSSAAVATNREGHHSQCSCRAFAIYFLREISRYRALA